MNKFEESIQSTLNKYVKDAFPSVQVKENIFNALDQSKTKKRLSIRFVRTAAVFSFIIAFIFCVNISPTFANYLNKLPLISNLIDIVRFDKGMEEILTRDKGMKNAVEKGYGTVINATATSNDITFTVENVVSDQKRMFITYSVKPSKEKYGSISSLWFNDITISGQNNVLVDLKNGMSTDLYFKNAFIPRNILGPGEVSQRNLMLPSQQKSDPEKLFGWMEILKQNDSAAFPTNLNVKINGWKASVEEDAKVYAGTWDITFDIPKELANAEPVTYKGTTFNISGENYNLDFNLDYTKVYPTVTTVKMDVVNAHNSPSSFFLKMHLEDESGRIYRNMEDEFTSSQQNVLTEFESCYFTNPKELYLVVESILKPAIKDPKKNEIVIDKKIKLF